MSIEQPSHDLSNTQHYIDIYFNQFHPAWPILHRGSFDKDNEPALLVQTVYMIGLWLSGDAVAKDAAKSLHQRHRVLIEQQRDQWDTSYTESDRIISPWPTATYQAILLHIIFSLITRKQSSVGIDLKLEIPASDYHLLYALVKTCIKQGMFCYADILAQSSDTAPIVCVWVAVEETKRFSMALYKVCKSCEVCPVLDDHQVQPHDLLTLGNLHFTLPDDDYLWDAGTNEELTDRLAEQARDRGQTSNREGDWISSCKDTVLSSKVKFDWI
ncbi:hypothetical protein MW887_004426 [Aspergillus wentii]|nr:hypothetical protein MW887_004426 [Aspergillus wentii]